MRRLLPLVLVACAKTASPAATPAAPAPEEAPAMLPTPFTAAQIHEAWPLGTRLHFRVESAGQLTQLQRWEVVLSNDEGMTIRADVIQETSGEEIRPADEGFSTWEELRDHALFPAASATREPGTFDTPWGALEGWRYVVRRTTEDGQPMTMTFDFATALPGPPVRVTTRVDGVLVSTMTMVLRESPEG